MSAIRSSLFSKPQDRRIRSAPTPAASSSASDICRWSVAGDGLNEPSFNLSFTLRKINANESIALCQKRFHFDNLQLFCSTDESLQIAMIEILANLLGQRERIEICRQMIGETIPCKDKPVRMLHN